jgi:hypothetical protein
MIQPEADSHKNRFCNGYSISVESHPLSSGWSANRNTGNNAGLSFSKLIFYGFTANKNGIVLCDPATFLVAELFNKAPFDLFVQGIVTG